MESWVPDPENMFIGSIVSPFKTVKDRSWIVALGTVVKAQLG